MFSDFRLATLMLYKSPGFTLVTVLSLGLAGCTSGRGVSKDPLSKLHEPAGRRWLVIGCKQAPTKEETQTHRPAQARKPAALS